MGVLFPIGRLGQTNIFVYFSCPFDSTDPSNGWMIEWISLFIKLDKCLLKKLIRSYEWRKWNSIRLAGPFVFLLESAVPKGFPSIIFQTITLKLGGGLKRGYFHCHQHNHLLLRRSSSFEQNSVGYYNFFFSVIILNHHFAAAAASRQTEQYPSHPVAFCQHGSGKRW